MSAYLPVGVFDSGIGGLSVVRHIRTLLPCERLIYVADSSYAPYGERSREEVTERALLIASYLLRRQVKAIVVACNTATAAAVEVLRETCPVPVVAMEPAIKPAAAMTRSDVIGVLATSGTFNSTRYASLLDRHGRDVRVLESVCHDWVRLVEAGRIEEPETESRVAADLAPLLDAGADVLVLGCTHFPFLLPLIDRLAAGRATILDPAPAVARQLQRRLLETGSLSDDTRAGGLELLCSGDAEQLSLLVRKLSGEALAVAPLPEFLTD